MMSNARSRDADAEFADATAKPPFLYETYTRRRARSRRRPGRPVTSSRWRKVAHRADPGAEVQVAIVKPVGTDRPCRDLVYARGGVAGAGNAVPMTGCRARLAVGVNAAVVFVDYDRYPRSSTGGTGAGLRNGSKWITSTAGTREWMRKGWRWPANRSAAK